MTSNDTRNKFFPGRIIHTLLKNNGVEEISNEIIDFMNETITTISVEIATIALKLTHFKGNKTIQINAIKDGTQQFLGRNLENLELKIFTDSNIKNFLKKNGAARISKEAIELMNRIITKIAEDIALEFAIIIHSNENKMGLKEALKLSTQKFLNKKLQKSEVK